jgi:hypothetical protein
MEEWNERIGLEDELESFIRLEEIYWKQRSGQKWVLEGDANTNFFHQFANGRRRKNTITSLDSDQGEIRGQKEITYHIVKYYKNLFGNSQPCQMNLNSNFWPHQYILSEVDNTYLVRKFEIEEIKDVIMEMRINSAPRPNGFGVSFFRSF